MAVNICVSSDQIFDSKAIYIGAACVEHWATVVCFIHVHFQDIAFNKDNASAL